MPKKSKHEDTIPTLQDDPTEPNPVVRRAQRDQTIPVEQLEMATDVDVLRGAVISPHGITPVSPRASSAGDPVIALAKPKSTASFVDRKYRLPTESEIKAAVEGTPTDAVPVIDD